MAIVELIMPKMGESIIEAAIISWLKKEGDRVEMDETVLEVATDKVDSEVPAQVSGIIKKILHQKDEVVAVGKPLALIEIEGDVEGNIEELTDNVPKTEIPRAVSLPLAPVNVETSSITTESPQEKIKEESEFVKLSSSKNIKSTIALSRRSLTERIPSHVEGRFYSPLVRNIARAEGITLEELSLLKGSGADDRVTKFDLLNYIDLKKTEGSSSVRRAQTTHIETPQEESQRIESTSKLTMKSPFTGMAQQTSPSRSESSISETPISSSSIGAQGDEIVEMSRMRKVIAGHMKRSINTSAHVTTFVEADATKLVRWRNQVKNEYQNRFGEKLTFSPLFTEAVIKALHDYPMINASISGEQLILKKAINIGIATAMENGNLIVPIIHNAGELNLHGLTKKLNDLTTRARMNKLTPDEIQGGTFTISNIGTFGNIMGTPIINQPELAILALGAIKKKAVIQETSEGDIIAIRHMMFLSLSFDHRVIDGYQGGVFLNQIAHYIETFDVNRPL